MPVTPLHLRPGAFAAVAAAFLCAPGAHATEALAAKGACTACHAAAKKMVGPSYQQIAARYRGDAKAPAVLARHVREGSKGVWGPTAMPATPPAKLSDAELKQLVAWILKTP